MKTLSKHQRWIVTFAVHYCHIVLLLIGSVGMVRARDITYGELAKIPEEQLPGLLQENRAGVLKVFRRIATRSDPEIATRISPTRQWEMTDQALGFIGQNTDDPADLAFLQSFFVNVEKTLNGFSEIPALRTIIGFSEKEQGISLANKQRMLRVIAGTAMDGYGLLANRLRADEEAAPVLLRKLESRDDDIASDAAQALGNLQSSTVVKYIKRPVLIGLTFLLADLSFRFYEKPMQKLGKSLRRKDPAAVPKMVG